MRNINNRLPFLFFILLPFFIFSQSLKQKDSLINNMCSELKKNRNLSDSLRINNVFQKHLYPYLSKFESKKIDSIGTSIYFRLQRNCSEFVEILSRIEPSNSDWEQLEKGYKPKSKLLKQKCRELNQFNNLSYLEYNGDKVTVELKDGIWVDNFIDGTYSKLNFKWINDCDFELKFIESNNEIRKNFSTFGDVYSYSLIEKKEGTFIVITKIPNENNYLKFKIYTK